MVKRSHGKMSKSTRKLGASARKLTVAGLVKKYNVGDKVALDHQSRYSGMPHPRYRGKSGKVLAKRGHAYEVQIRDGNATKVLVVSPVHLKLI
jgi:large subunit ribosomal protein L21e